MRNKFLWFSTLRPVDHFNHVYLFESRLISNAFQSFCTFTWMLSLSLCPNTMGTLPLFWRWFPRFTHNQLIKYVFVYSMRCSRMRTIHSAYCAKKKKLVTLHLFFVHIFWCRVVCCFFLLFFWCCFIWSPKYCFIMFIRMPSSIHYS